MTFAVPLFLIAALAGIIPVVLHMVNRRSARQLPFPTLRFLRISVEKTRRRKRIHDILLMLVRTAALVLIAFGLARPTVTNLGALLGRGAETAVAIILDNSASMGLIDQDRQRLETATGTAQKILDQLADGDAAVLLPTCGPASAEPERLDQGQEKVRQMLSECRVSYQRADLPACLRQARKLLADSKAPNRAIFILTAQQELSWQGLKDSPSASPQTAQNETATADLTPDEKEILAIPVVIVDCNRAPKPNVAVQKVDVQIMAPVTGLPVRAAVELLNASTVPQSRRVELLIDGAAEQSSPELNIPAGARATHVFTFVFQRGGLHRGEVRLAGEDGSKLDDRRFFSVEVDHGIPVAVVKPKRHEIACLEDTFYVEQALAPVKSVNGALRVDSLTAAELPTAALTNYKVIYCVNLPAPDADTAGRLAAYVAGGGNLVWICGDNVVPDDYNQANLKTQEQLLPAPLLAVRWPKAGSGRDSWKITSLDKEHRALSHLVEPASLYQSVLVYKHVRVDAGGAAGARVLARLDDGEPLLVQRDIQRGKVLLLGTSAHVNWSNLPLRPIFLPLLIRLTFELAAVQQTHPQVLAGAPLVLDLPGEQRPLGVEIQPPSGETIRLKTQPASGKPGQVFRYADTPDVGIYLLRLIDAARPTQIAYAVNVDPDEAEPKKIDAEQLQRLLAPTPVVFAANPDDLSDTFTWLREGKSLWELFLAGVLLVLVFETFLANRWSPNRPAAQSSPRPVAGEG